MLVEEPCPKKGKRAVTGGPRTSPRTQEVRTHLAPWIPGTGRENRQLPGVAGPQFVARAFRGQTSMTRV